MSGLEPVAENIWVCAVPHSFVGLHVGTRMTVVRLSSGAVLLHSPVAITAELRAAIDAIGPVQHVVCPNLFHHLFAGEALSAWPIAKLHGPARLRQKRSDLRFDAVLSDTPDPDWQGDIIPVTIRGSLLGETVLFHVPSKTLITSDLVENFQSHPHWLTRTYLKMNGMFGNITWPPLMRIAYLNRRAARASMDRILDLPFERIIIAHGDLITHNARESLRNGLKWL
jgi:hypothetical protein